MRAVASPTDTDKFIVSNWPFDISDDGLVSGVTGFQQMITAQAAKWLYGPGATVNKRRLSVSEAQAIKRVVERARLLRRR